MSTRSPALLLYGLPPGLVHAFFSIPRDGGTWGDGVLFVRIYARFDTSQTLWRWFCQEVWQANYVAEDVISMSIQTHVAELLARWTLRKSHGFPPAMIGVRGMGFIAVLLSCRADV